MQFDYTGLYSDCKMSFVTALINIALKFFDLYVLNNSFKVFVGYNPTVTNKYNYLLNF